MKKILEILIISAVLLTTAIVFTTCKQFIDNPEEFLGYWSSEVVPTDFSIDKPTQKIGDVECIPSYWNGTYSDVTLTIKLHNPRKFSLITPTSTSSAADVQKIINFPGLLTPPAYGTDYALEQTPDKQALQLTYKSGFLKAHEWSNGSIGPEITLTSTDGRKFGKKFRLNIEANTPPPEIGDITIAKDGVHYVLCFTVDDSAMNTTIPGGKLHKDLGLVIAKEGGETTKIPLPIGSSGFAVDSAAELLPSASQITDPVPTGTWKVYFKTDTSLTQSTLPQKYTVRLIDRKGLSSAPKEAHTLGYIPDLNDAGTAWKNLKKAVESAEAGGVITVMGNVTATTAPGNYGTINVTKSLTIKGKIGTTLDANQGALALSAHRIFTVTGNKTELTLENLTLKNGYANPGGSMDYKYGGAIDGAGIKTLTLKHCTIEDCTAYGGGGIFLAGRVETVLESCTITGCTATGAAGGAIYAGNSYDEQPVVHIKGGLIKGNKGYITGGAIDIARGSLYIEKDKDNNPTKIENNTVIASGGQGNGGGGISYYWDAAKPGELKIENAEITNCNIKYNSSGDGKAHGAGIYVYGNGKVSLSNVTLNQCGFTGEILGNEFNQKQGGGICLRKVSTATIKGCTIENSTTANEGGGIYATDTNLTIENTKIKNNQVEKKGGGLFFQVASADVNLIIKGTTEFENNNVNLSSGDSWGGGIYMKGANSQSVKAIMTGGKFVSNRAHDGGGIYIDSYAAFTMKGGSLNNNTVPTGSGGGEGCAVYINNNGTFIWAGGTITGHTPNHVIEGNGTFTNNSGNTES